jgi:MFS family permease
MASGRGVVACSFGAANFIGAPILGALSDRFGRRPILRTSFSVMAGCLLLTGLAAANAAFGLFVMPETLAAEDRRPLAWQRLTPFSSIHDLASLRGVGPLAAVLTLAYLAQFMAPAIGSGLLVAVSGSPADDWRLGAPFYASSLLLLAAAAVAEPAPAGRLL